MTTHVEHILLQMKYVARVRVLVTSISNRIDSSMGDVDYMEQVLKDAPHGTIAPATRARVLQFIADLRSVSRDANALSEYLYDPHAK